MAEHLLEAERARAESLLRREQAAEYVRDIWGVPCSPNTLAKLASLGGGPEYRRIGRHPHYPSNALDRWAASKISRRVSRASELREVAL
jgi:hypothetical protein